jgi:lipoyl(octanoyl) transferase
VVARIEWKASQEPVPYAEALEFMDRRVAAIREGRAGELVWLLEHPALYTAGTSARPEDLLEPERLPVHRTGRGGQYTYHGPGQRIAYLMLDLTARQGSRGPDLKGFVADLEEWLVKTLARFGVEGFQREGRVGIWVVLPQGGEAKIAALGLRVRRWVSLHGVSLNVSPELSHYAGIVPCGIRDAGVTSLAALGVGATMDDVDAVLREEFERVFAR